MSSELGIPCVVCEASRTEIRHSNSGPLGVKPSYQLQAQVHYSPSRLEEQAKKVFLALCCFIFGGYALDATLSIPLNSGIHYSIVFTS
jgi:hypothetical protein